MRYLKVEYTIKNGREVLKEYSLYDAQWVTRDEAVELVKDFIPKAKITRITEVEDNVIDLNSFRKT